MIDPPDVRFSFASDNVRYGSPGQCQSTRTAPTGAVTLREIRRATFPGSHAGAKAAFQTGDSPRGVRGRGTVRGAPRVTGLFTTDNDIPAKGITR